MFAPGSETCSPYKADNELRASDGADSVDASRNGWTIFWSRANASTKRRTCAAAVRAHADLVGDATRRCASRARPARAPAPDSCRYRSNNDACGDLGERDLALPELALTLLSTLVLGVEEHLERLAENS